ncbi:Hypothetical protein KFL_006710040 [Klebsormidium nitens]|uniref:RING-type E3 ubiquitin transferase n=1 Tax=Klebsormidium nitens TaxID=105231 RepID=A0A1Y1IIP3_KLENI|nr:Hypothetical protein KFL_006710040 [Klebsormidium nitens]|eukprot:GAQ90674.1 Hypothetical protein KFL_006710040 [Klebsormidium nitens]
MAGNAVAAALCLAKKLYTAILKVPQLRKQCADLENVVLSLEAVIENLADAEDNHNVRRLLGELQDALQEGLGIVQQGEGKGLRNWARLVLQGENVAKRLAAVSRRIELGLSTLIPGIRGQMGKIDKNVAEVNAQLKELKEQLDKNAEAIEKDRAEILDRVRKVAQRGGSSSDAQHNGERIIELLAQSSMGTVSVDRLEKEWKVFRSEGMLGPGEGQAWVSDADMVIEDVMFRHVLDTEKLLEEKEKAELESLRWKEEAMLAAKNAAENERLRRSVALLNQELEATRESRDTSQEALKKAFEQIESSTPAHILERMLNELHAKAGVAKESAKSDHQKADHLYPRSFTCRICSCTLEDPVIVETGYSFCQKCLEQHLGSDKPTCPVTRRPINNRIAIKNIDLHLAITEWWEWLSDWIGRERALLSCSRPPDSPRSIISSPRQQRTVNGLAGEDASSTVSAEVTKDPDVMAALSNLLLDGGLNAKVAIGAEQLTDLLQAHPQKWMQVYEAEAVEPLVRVLGLKGQVRLFAVTALEAIMAAAVREAYGNNNKVAENACGEIIEKARDSLLELLSDESPAVRGKAAETIGHCLEVRTISVLLAKQEKTGLITGLVHLSFAEGLHEMMHGVHGPATVECVRGIGRRVLCQLARVVVTNQAQSAKLAADPAPEDVVDSLWKLVLDRATTIEALQMLTWLAQGAPSGLSEQSVVEGAGARERTAVLTYLLGQAESNKPLRLPLANFLAGLAATVSEPGDLLGTGGVDKLLRLLQSLVKEIGAEPGAAEGWACVSFLVDLLATTSTGEGEDETQEGSADVKRRELSVTTLLELLRFTTRESLPRARFSDLGSSLQTSVQNAQSSALRCVAILSVSRPFARRFVEEGGVELISRVLQAVRSRTRDCAKALAGLMAACPVKAETALKNSAALVGLCKILDGGNGEERLAALHVLDLVVSTGSVAQNLEPAWLCPEGEESANCRAAGVELFAKLSSTNGWGDRGTAAIGAALGFLTDAQKRGLVGGPAVQSVLQALTALTSNAQLCTALMGDKHGVTVLVQVAKQLRTPTAQIMTQISECVPETAAADSRFVAALVSLLDDPDAQSAAADALDKLASGAVNLGNLAGAGNAHITVLLKAVPLAKVEDKVMLVRVLWRLCKGIGAAVIEAVVSGGGVKILFTAARTLEASGRTGDAVACLVAIDKLEVAATDLGRDIVAASATAFLVKLLDASVKGSRKDRVRYAVFFLGCAAQVDPDACMHAGIIPALELHLADAKDKDECTLAGTEVIAALLSGVSGETAKDALVKSSAAAHCAALARAGKRCPGKAQNVSCGGECINEATKVTKELARSRSSNKSSWRGTLGRVSSSLGS